MTQELRLKNWHVVSKFEQLRSPILGRLKWKKYVYVLSVKKFLSQIYKMRILVIFSFF